MNDTLYIIPTYERTKAIQPVLRSIENAGVPMDVFIMVKTSSPETRTRYSDLFASMTHDGSLTVVDQDQNIGWDFIAWKAAIDRFKGKYRRYVFGVDDAYFATDGWLAMWDATSPAPNDMVVWGSTPCNNYKALSDIRPPYVITDDLIRKARNYEVPCWTTCNTKWLHVANAEVPWLSALNDFCTLYPFRVVKASALGIAIGGSDIQYSGYDNGMTT